MNMEIVASLWSGSVPIVVALIMLYWNQRAKLKWEKRIRKEERYQRLLNSMTGFYEGTECQKSKDEFIDQSRLAWLYCPDSVVRLANRFLETVEGKEKKSMLRERETALGNLVLEMRREMYPKTSLNTTDFRLWKSLD